MSTQGGAFDRPFSLDEETPGPIGQFFLEFTIGKVVPAVFAFMRGVAPVFRVPFTNVVLVTRFDDVQEICDRHDDFPVPYQKMVDHLAWEPTFLLAMKDTPEYRETLANVRRLWASEDLDFVREIAREAAEEAMTAAGGRIDAIQELMVPVTKAIIVRYYGIPIAEEDWQPFRDGSMHTAGYLFGGQSVDAKKIDTAQRAIGGVWRVIDKAIAAAHEKPLPENTIIGRCHAQQVTDDAHLRSYLMGMIVGYLPTNTNANGRVLGILIKRREAYAAALEAAATGDRDLMLRVMHEALRLNYILPGLWRTTEEPRALREDTDRPARIDRGRLIYISAMAAMRDPRRVKKPGKFDPNRSSEIDMVYGHQFHYCVGDRISDVMMQEIFMALMKRKPQPVGRMVMRGNFPWTQVMEFKPETEGANGR